MNNSTDVPSRWKTPLLASILTLTAGIGLFRLASPAAAGDAASAGAPPTVDMTDAKKVDFVKDVQPIFKASCVKCHGLDATKPKKKAAAQFQLDDKTAAFKGGRSGTAIVPGDSKNSLLFKLLSGPVPRPVKGEDDKDIDPMPKVKRGEKWKPLPADQIAIIKLWIDQGANWPN